MNLFNEKKKIYSLIAIILVVIYCIEPVVVSANAVNISYENTIDVSKSILRSDEEVDKDIKETDGKELFLENEVTSQKDSKIPVIKEIKVDKKSATIGDIVKITVDIYDSESGIKDVMLDIKVDFIDIGYRSIPAVYNNDTKVYEYSFKITNKIPSGSYSVEANAVDNENNSSHQGNWDAFKVVGTGVGAGDYLPKVESLRLNTKEVKLGETISLEIKLTEPILSTNENPVPAEAIWSRFSREGNFENISFYLKYNYQKSVYEGEYTVMEQSVSGNYTINSIGFENNNNIYDLSDKIIEMSKFKVTGTEGLHDTEAPKVKTITFNKETATIGDLVEIIVDTDENGYCYGSIEMQIENKPNVSHWMELQNVEDGKVKATWSLDENVPSGKWVVKYINLTDSKNNSGYYSGSELIGKTSDLKVTGTENSINLGFPKLKNINVNKVNASLGDTFLISSEIEELKIKPTKVEAVYKVENQEYLMPVELYYNNKTKKYEKLVTVNGYTQNGLWELVGVEMRINVESKYISTIILDEVDSEYKLADILITNEIKEDKEIPILNSIKVDRATANVGEKIKYTVSAEDKHSGISKMLINFNGKGGPGMIHTEVALKYNNQTALFEGELEVTEYLLNNKPTLAPFMITIIDNVGNGLNKRLIDEDYMGKLNVVLYAKEDLNKDKVVNEQDLRLLAKLYDKTSQDKDWNALYDINKDGIIDVFDMVTLSKKILKPVNLEDYIPKEDSEIKMEQPEIEFLTE